GGSADTDAKAVTVIPQGLPPTSQVTSTTPLACALIASANSEGDASSDGGSAMSLKVWLMSPPARHGSRPPRGRPQTVPVASRCRRLHRDRDAVRDHVEDSRALLCSVDQVAQLLLRRVARDPERDVDLLEPVAEVVGETERSLDVHLALERRLDLGQPD